MTAAVNLPGVVMASAHLNPAIALYGEPGVGKTSLAASFPGGVFLQTEAGIPAGIEVASFGLLNSFSSVMTALGNLYSSQHPYKTLVVDSVSALQPLVWAETCRRGDANGTAKANIEAFGYGKGYVFALAIWTELIEGLEALRDDRGMSIVLIAHSTIRKFADPESAIYDRYELDLQTSGGRRLAAMSRRLGRCQRRWSASVSSPCRRRS